MEFLGLVFSIVVLAVFFLPIWAFIRLSRVNREVQELRAQMASVEVQLSVLAGRVSASPRPAAPAPAPPVKSAAPAAAAPPPVVPPPIPLEPEAPRSSFGPAYGMGPTPPAAPPAPEPRPAPPAPFAPPAPDAPFAPVAPDESDLETRIGGSWLLYTGVLVVLLGVGFFLKYAFDNQWIDERGRVIAGGIAGIGLIAGGIRFNAHGLATFGQALIGTGLAILYLAIYAALNFYQLIDRTSAFVLMVVVTIASGLLADRTRSQALAVIAVGGGFITPFLVGSGQDAQVTLFTYDALLVVGTLALVWRHHWLSLIALSYVATFFTLLGWAARYYSDDKWLRTLLFLTLFCALFIQILRSLRNVDGALAAAVRGLLWTAPVFYHVFAVVLTTGHPPAFHVYVIAFTLIGLALTAEPHRPLVRLVILLAAYLPLFADPALPDGLSWILPNSVAIVAVAALHIVGLLDRVYRQSETLDPLDMLSLHVTGLGLFGLLYDTLQAAYPDFRGGLAAIIAIGAIALWQLLQTRDWIASLNAAALAFTLAAIGVAVQFDGPAAVVGWAAEGAAAAWFGMRAGSIAFQYGGLMLWTLAAVRLLESYDQTPAGFTAILNTRAATTLFVVGLAYLLAWLFNRYREGVSEPGRIRAALHVAAAFLTIVWMTAEIGSYWDVRYEVTQAYLYEQLMISLAWGLYGATLIVFGMWRAYAPVRYIGITVLGVTILKVFFMDLWELGGIYRVIGFLVFGMLLMLVSYLYQRRKQLPIA